LEQGRRRKWRYLEFRSRIADWKGASGSLAFYGHHLDLGPSVEALFARFAGSARRAVRKAEASGVRVEFGTGLDAMRTFYSLHCQTRRRLGWPPQPFRFFEAIHRHILFRDQGFVATALRDNHPLASAVFFVQGENAFFKFGASDRAAQQFRPNNLVMWQSIKRLVDGGCRHLHFGRTSLSNQGLRRFKLGFGTTEERIEYRKYDFAREGFVTDVERTDSPLNRLLSHVPTPLLRLAGELLYPHSA
jgi:lipid II:glycine glycyltransferase (peptidoglycan interpeptide bridge formation enzyme)